MKKLLKYFFVVFILSLLIISLIYFYIPTDLNIVDKNKVIVTIESGYGGEVEITNEQKQELIGILQKVKFYRGASFLRFQSGVSANSVITLTGDYNNSYNFVHLYILEKEPNKSFAQLSTETKYRMKSEDVEKIILFLHSVK